MITFNLNITSLQATQNTAESSCKDIQLQVTIGRYCYAVKILRQGPKHFSFELLPLVFQQVQYSELSFEIKFNV